MRSKNAVRNLVFYLIAEMLVFCLGIIFPRLIILNYGSAVNGLTSTITRILSLINLIQAGAVGAAIFQMYKPVAENDYETQSAILYTSRKFYKKFSFFYLIISIIIACAFPFFLKDGSLTYLEAFFPFCILAINGTGLLLFNSICDIYISSHQKRYLLSIALISEQIVRYSLLAIVIFCHLPFVFIYVCYLIGGIVSIVINLVFYNLLAKGHITKKPLDKNYKIPGRKYLMFSSFGSEAVTASPTIIITLVVGLVYSSIFSVYAMIFTSMKIILNSIHLSFSAVFGNLVKTSDDKKIAKVYDSIELFTICLGTFLASCVGFLVMPFIALYSKNADANYVYNILGVFVVIYTVCIAFHTAFGYVATVYGLFKDTCIIVLVFGFTGIIISILSVIFFGMPFVMLGLIFNQLGCAIATLVVIKKRISWFRIKKTIIRTLFMALVASISTSLYFVFKPQMSSWFEWIFAALIVACGAVLIMLVYCLIFERYSLKNLFLYVKIFMKKKRSS